MDSSFMEMEVWRLLSWRPRMKKGVHRRLWMVWEMDVQGHIREYETKDNTAWMELPCASAVEYFGLSGLNSVEVN